jgi:hypothetical protein
VIKAKLWTAANGIMLLMFLFSAVVQFNDPDPVAWMAVYLAAAAVCLVEIRRKTPRWLPMALGVIALVWSGSIAYRVRDVPISALFAEWEMRNLRVEEAREMYGLAIVGVWMLTIVAVRSARVK